MKRSRRHIALLGLLLGSATGACDAGASRDTRPADTRLSDVSDVGGGDATDAVLDSPDDPSDTDADASDADTDTDTEADPDAPDSSDDVPDTSSADATDDGFDANDASDVPDDASDVSDVPDDASEDAVPDPCARCDAAQVCVEGSCLGGAQFPCDEAALCAPGFVCGLGGTCASARPAADVRMEYLGSPLRDWPAEWIFTYAFRDRVGFGMSVAFAESDEAGLQVVIAATSDGLNNLCQYDINGHDWMPDEPSCTTDSANTNTVAWIPPHGDLPARFVLGGGNRLVHVTDNFGEQVSLFGPDTLSDDRLCAAFSIHPMDVDLDGLLDVVVGCHGPASLAGTLKQVLVLRALSDGTYERMPDRHASEFRRECVLLALPGLDINNDGLLDYVYILDTFSNPDRRNTLNTPSFVLFRCAPTEECTWRTRLLDDGLDAWGSHMGAGLVSVDTIGPLLAISDWGPRDLRDLTTRPIRDLAAAAAFAGGRDAADTEYIYSWSMAVADFDRNGLRDVLATQGTAEIRRLERSPVPEHPDLLLLQHGGGTFETRPEADWLVYPDDTPLAPEVTQYHRGAIVQDFDLDGRLDVLVNQYGHAPVLYEERGGEHPPRCVLRFVPGVVPTAGPGIQTGRTALGPWDAAVLQGEMRLQSPLRAVVDDRAGFVRFPSGAVVPYDCGDTVGPHDVIEPDWLRFEYGDAAIRIVLDRSVWSEPIETIEVAWVDAERRLLATGTPDDEDVVPIPDVAGVDAFMLRINGRWVGRFFGLVAPE